jgi:hypothetical protein
MVCGRRPERKARFALELEGVGWGEMCDAEGALMMERGLPDVLAGIVWPLGPAA